MRKIAALLAVVTFLGCKDEVTSPIALADCGTASDPLLEVTLPDGPVPADGTTLTLVSLRIPRATVSPRKIAVSATSGTFTAAEVLADRCGFATAALRSAADPGLALVSATYGGVARALDSLRFVRAWPEQILMSTALPNNSTADPVTIQLRLLRGVGQVSPGTIVSLAASFDGNPIGIVQPAMLFIDATGTGLAKFAVTDPTFRGVVRVTAVVDTVGGTVSSFTTFALIKGP